MLDQIAFNINEEGDSVLTISNSEYGMEITLTVETQGNMTDWDTAMLDYFGDDFNTLLDRMRGDFHRLRKSLSSNAQLEAYGLAPSFSEQMKEVLGDGDEPEDS